MTGKDDLDKAFDKAVKQIIADTRDAKLSWGPDGSGWNTTWRTILARFQMGRDTEGKGGVKTAARGTLTLDGMISRVLEPEVSSKLNEAIESSAYAKYAQKLNWVLGQ